MTPRDYNAEFKREIASLGDKRPSLFLHACCGPCLAYPLSILSKHFNLTVGFINPNIQPEEEYQRRLLNLEKLLKHYSDDNSFSYRVVLIPEDFTEYKRLFADRKDDREGGQVCLRCHAYRLSLSYRYASLHHYDYFTTVMTVSCKKPSRELNEIAERLEKLYPETKYLYSDFKKEDGQLKGIKIAKMYDIYRQNYCGCAISLTEREDYLNRRKAS